MEIRKKIIEFLETMDAKNTLEIYREYAEKNSLESFFAMEEFDGLEDGRTPLQILQDISPDFNVNDEYIWNSIYGWESGSADDVIKELVDFAKLADFILENKVDAEDIENEEDIAYYIEAEVLGIPF